MGAPETLRVGIITGDQPYAGMAADLVRALGAGFGPVPCDGPDGLLAGLDTGALDCVVAGIPITPGRALLVAPYLITGHALAVDVVRFPRVRAVADLAGLTVGVRDGDSEGESLAAQGRAEVSALHWAAPPPAGCAAVLASAPALRHLIGSLPDVDVVAGRLSRVPLALAVARSRPELCARLTQAQAAAEADGTLQEIRAAWLGNPYRDQSLAII